MERTKSAIFSSNASLKYEFLPRDIDERNQTCWYGETWIEILG